MNNVELDKQRYRPPWHRHHSGTVTTRTKKNWRQLADAIAKDKGGSFACHICKRPIKYRRGFFDLKSPDSAKARPTRHHICRACYEHLNYYINHLIATTHRDNLPLEE